MPPKPIDSDRDVLVVEDSPLQAQRLKRLLEKGGYRARVAANGREGLGAVQVQEPLLIISDILMPVMNGYEMCRALKNNDAFKHIPIILLTSLSDPKDVFLGLHSGADSYVSKPYEESSLLARIDVVLENARRPEPASESEELNVFLKGVGYKIGASRKQILNLLLSTYQDAVEQNRRLREMRAKLVSVNEKLEKLVAERTAALAREISERQRIEQVLVSEKERLSVTLQSITDGLITTNAAGQVILMNRAAENLTGWPQAEAVGKPITQVFNLQKTETQGGRQVVVDNILQSGSVFGLDDQIVLKNRNNLDLVVAVSGTPIFDQTHKIIGVIFVFRDITRQKQMEEELVKAQKLDSLGVLAGGIAHDFNNLLTGILGNISLAKMKNAPQEKRLVRLKEAEKAVMRAKYLTQQLLTFSKGGAPVRQVMSIAPVVRESARFALRGSKARCEIEIASKLCPVNIDEGQISQVIHNLVINADQAMSDGGIIKVRAESLIVDPERRPGVPLRPGKYVRISITDHGPGIPREHLQKIFDPYFTTKEKGTGLGLATSYSILKNHGGIISVKSKEGHGSTFSIYLPAVTEERTPPGAPSAPQTDRPAILVMDDGEALRSFLGDLLEHLGYRVGLAADGQEALEAYRKAKEAGKPFDCVLLDLTISDGMGGKETIKRLLEMDPTVRAIVSSGYNDDPIMANFEKYGFAGVVAKPYEVEQLSKVINTVLAKDK